PRPRMLTRRAFTRRLSRVLSGGSDAYAFSGEGFVDVARPQVPLERGAGELRARRADDDIVERFEARLLVNTRAHPTEIGFEIAAAQRRQNAIVVGLRTLE